VTTLAFIGGDGAGKTTIAKGLVSSHRSRMRYLYMGSNPQASNYSLPTSRLILRMKVRSYEREAELRGITDPNFLTTQHPEHRKVERGMIGTWLRLIHRLAEEGYRQLVSWTLQLRGFVVVYDRHPYFDLAPRDPTRPPKSLDRRIHFWIFKWLFPKPDIVFLLDGPSDVLAARTGEVTERFLDSRRQAFLEHGKNMDHFHILNSTNSPEVLLEEVERRLKIRPMSEVSFYRESLRGDE
jgi:thymidylate kinase